MGHDTIGVIGIGSMGWQMAAHLVRGGLQVLAYDADRERCERFAREFSTRQPTSVRDLAGASVVMTMLPTGAIVRQVLTDGGEASLVNTLLPGSVVLDTTSSVPAGTRELGAMLARRGVAMVDAPVSGAVTGATEGNLVFMIGADDPASIEKVIPLLSLLGKRMFRTGPLGSGHAMKSMNNFVAGAAYAASCEALIIGQKYGLDPGTMIDILNVSTGRNHATERNMKKIVERTFNGTFQLGLFTKDLKIAAEMADTMGVAAPISHLIHDWMAEARDNIGGTGDHTTAYLYWEQKARASAKE